MFRGKFCCDAELGNLTFQRSLLFFCCGIILRFSWTKKDKEMPHKFWKGRVVRGACPSGLGNMSPTLPTWGGGTYVGVHRSQTREREKGRGTGGAVARPGEVGLSAARWTAGSGTSHTEGGSPVLPLLWSEFQRNKILQCVKKKSHIPRDNTDNHRTNLVGEKFFEAWQKKPKQKIDQCDQNSMQWPKKDNLKLVYGKSTLSKAYRVKPD